MGGVTRKNGQRSAGKLKQMLVPLVFSLLVLGFVCVVILYLGGTFGRAAETEMQPVIDNFLSVVSITIYASSAVLLCVVYAFSAYNGLPDHRLVLLIAFFVMLFFGRCHPYFLIITGSPGGLWGIEMMQWLCLLPLFLFGAFLLSGWRRIAAAVGSALLMVIECVRFLIHRASGEWWRYQNSRLAAATILLFVILCVVELVLKPEWRKTVLHALPVLFASLVICFFTTALKNDYGVPFSFVGSMAENIGKGDLDLLVMYLTSSFSLAVTVLIMMDYIRKSVQFRSRMGALEQREQTAVENYRIMLQSQDETRRERHEMRHHMVLLNEMLAHGQTERAKEYISFLMDQIDAIPSGTYSDNMVINAIAGHYLNSAKAERVSVLCDIQATEKTVLLDEELCVLLTNMLENAEEACRLMDRSRQRFIHFKFRSSEDHLSVICENSTDTEVIISRDGSVQTSKDDAGHHGYGIAAMKRIVENHGGMFTVTCADGKFTVKATI